MDRRIPSNDDDTGSPFQAERPHLPRRITPDDVDTRWPFRAGYPRLLRPSVISIPIEEEKPISDTNFDQLQSRIFEILESYDLSWVAPDRDFVVPGPRVVYRKQKSGTAGLARVLINCRYDKDTSYSEKWTKAVVEIYEEVQSVIEGDREVGVELVDMTYMDTSRTCALPTPMAQELSANWENGHNYCQQILQLFEAPHEMFQVMVPIGTCSLGHFTSTVVFFDALNAEDSSWDSIEEKIRSILPSHIGVEIRQRSGPLFFSPQSFLDKYGQVIIPGPEEFQRPPRLGCDIGAKDSLSAGTMGGYVATEDKNGNRTTYGVTNAHVALGSYEKGVFIAPAHSDIKMESPSKIYRAGAKPKVLKWISQLEKEIQNSKETIDAFQEEDPDLSRKTKKYLDSYELWLASAKSTLEVMEQEPYIGSVYRASMGNRVYSVDPSQREIMMDLALIKMRCRGAERPQKIYLKERIKPPKVQPNAACDTWETDSLGVSHDGDGKNHIKVVGKLSRTGDYTFGIVNDFRAIAYPFKVNGAENKVKHYMWVASNPASHTDGATFSREGDSGSFVIAAADWEYRDYDNRVAMPPPQASLKTRLKYTQPFVVGLIFGGREDAELSYFIPFDAVKSEIESITGEKLVWPRKRSECVRDHVA